MGLAGAGAAWPLLPLPAAGVRVEKKRESEVENRRRADGSLALCFPAGLGERTPSAGSQTN